MMELVRAKARESRAMSLEVCPAHRSQTSALVQGKYYAVARSLRLGVYDSWNECALQVIGVKGTIYKSFSTKEQAEEFLYQNRLA